MKKLSLIIAIVAIIALAGCATGGRGAADLPPFELDLSNARVVPLLNDEVNLDGAFVGTRNVEPLERAWRWFVILFDPDSLPSNITDFTRVTIETRYFDADGNEIEPEDGNMQLAMFIDVEGDLHTDFNPNLILKEMNIMGFSCVISTDRGVRIRLRAPPQGMVLQASQGAPSFIELTRVVFHNNTASGE